MIKAVVFVMIPDLIEPTGEIVGMLHSKVTNLYDVIQLLKSDGKARML